MKKITLLFLTIIGCTISYVALGLNHAYPPVIPAKDGQRLILATGNKLNLYDELRTRAYSLFGKRCSYSLIGWDSTDILYFKTACGGKTSITKFDIESLESESVSEDQLSQQLTVKEVSPLDYVLTRDWDHPSSGEPLNVSPPTTDEETFRKMVTMNANGLASNSGKWIALVTKHINGPQDVVIVEKY